MGLQFVFTQIPVACQSHRKQWNGTAGLFLHCFEHQILIGFSMILMSLEWKYFYYSLIAGPDLPDDTHHPGSMETKDLSQADKEMSDGFLRKSQINGVFQSA